MSPRESASNTSISKTLDRGLAALEYIAKHPNGIMLSDVARHLDVHRTIAHRLIGTLELHNLVRRSNSKLISPAAGLITLASSVERDLQSLSRPVLQRLADKLGATTHLEVPIGDDRAQALLVVEPVHSAAHIAFRAGQVHPLDKGSGGLAILAAREPREGEREEVTLARERGYAVSRSELIPSALGLSAGVPAAGFATEFSIGVTVFQDSQLEKFAQLVLDASAELFNLINISGYDSAAASSA